MLCGRRDSAACDEAAVAAECVAVRPRDAKRHEPLSGRRGSATYDEAAVAAECVAVRPRNAKRREPLSGRHASVTDNEVAVDTTWSSLVVQTHDSDEI